MPPVLGGEEGEPVAAGFAGELSGRCEEGIATAVLVVRGRELHEYCSATIDPNHRVADRLIELARGRSRAAKG